MSTDFIRPRLALILAAPSDGGGETSAIERALSGGDVASVFISPAGQDTPAFQARCAELVPIIQAAGAAAIVADDTRAAARTQADGVHVTGGSLEALQDAMARFASKFIVGGSGFKTRHEALEAGETMPDYLFFGRLAGAPAAEAQPRDLELASWWADLVEIPCILMGGGDLETLAETASCGAEFIALSNAVFAVGGEEGERVARANAILDEVHRGRTA